MTKSSKDPLFTGRESQGLHTTFAVPSNTPPEENRAPEKTDKVLKKKEFPAMEIELVGRRYHAHMEHDGKVASEQLPLYWQYLETQKEKHLCLQHHQIVFKLLKKVGFEY